MKVGVKIILGGRLSLEMSWKCICDIRRVESGSAIARATVADGATQKPRQMQR